MESASHPVGLVTGQLLAAVGLEGVDPAHASVTFTPGVSHRNVPVGVSGPYTLVPRQVRGVLDGEGFLCSVDGQGGAGGRGVALAADVPWQVSVRVVDGEGAWVRTLDPFPLRVLPGESVDLARVMGDPVVPVPGGESARALADVAERHAGVALSAASRAADEAGAARAAAEGAGSAAERSAAGVAGAVDSAAEASKSAGVAAAAAELAQSSASTAVQGATTAASAAREAQSAAQGAEEAAAQASGRAGAAEQAAGNAVLAAQSSAAAAGRAELAASGAAGSAQSAQSAAQSVRQDADAGAFTPAFSIGTVRTDLTGTAKAAVRGTPLNPILDLDIPRGEPGGFNAGTYLGDNHLDTILAPGLYYQNSSGKILVEKGYPAGISGPSARLNLMVVPWGGSGAIVQILTTVGNATRPSLVYRRYAEGETFSRGQ